MGQAEGLSLRGMMVLKLFFNFEIKRERERDRDREREGPDSFAAVYSIVGEISFTLKKSPIKDYS